MTGSASSSPEPRLASNGAHPRIVLFTTGDSALLHVLLRSGPKLCGIVQNVSSRRPEPTARRSVLYRLARRGYRLLRPAAPSLARVAAREGIPYYLMSQGCDDRLARWVGQRAPDLIVICGMVNLLKENVRRIPPLGAINLHPSLLPKYRGPDPVFWTYHDMDLVGGATVHFIDDGADTGDVIFQEGFPIRPGMRRVELLDQAMGVIGPRLVLEATEALARGECPRSPQPSASPTVLARRVKPEEHRGLVGWESWPIERVWHFLRGTEPGVPALDPPPGWRRRFGWSVGEYVRRDPPVGIPPGSIARDDDGFFAVHPGGRIRLSVRHTAKTPGATLFDRRGSAAAPGPAPSSDPNP